MKRTLPEKKEYYAQLYNQSFDYVYSYVYVRTAYSGGLAEEIVQEAFTSAWQALDRFKGKSSFSTWVCSIAKNKLREHYRKELRRDKHEISGGNISLVQDAINLEKAVLEKESRQLVQQVLEKMPAQYRYALILKYMDGLSVKEIASVAGRTPKAIDGVLQRAKASFEKVYIALEGSDEKNE